MDYKKAYKEALVRAKEKRDEYKRLDGEESFVPSDIEYIFPELKESEDEKMWVMAIKAVYAPEAQSCIKSWGINPDDVIAWLEKQGEQKTDKYEGYCEGCNNFKGCITCVDGDQWAYYKEVEQKPIISNNALREGIAHFGITQYQIDNWLKKYVDVEKQGEQETSDENDIEYTQTDSFIEKACEWLKSNIKNYQNWEYNEFHQCVEYDGSYDIEKMISDFRKAIKE